MKYFVWLFVLCLSLSANAQVVVNDANAEPRNVTGFTSIRVSGGIDIYLSQGNSEGVAVSASEKKYAEKIVTEVKDGVLIIYYQKENGWWGDGVSNKKLKAYVTVKDLQKLQASGASDVHISGTLNVRDLKVSMSGASDLKGEIVSEKLTIDNSGASDVDITGSAYQVKIHLSGASDFKNYNFTADYCDVQVSGASDVKITVNKEITAGASGASDVSFRGSAVIKSMNSSGASSVKKKS